MQTGAHLNCTMSLLDTIWLCLFSCQQCLNQMRVGREFRTTVDSSEEEEENGGGGESESLQGGGIQQASSSAMDDGEAKRNPPAV